MNTVSVGNVVLFFIFLLLVSSFGRSPTTISYAIFSVFIGFFLICALGGAKFNTRFIWFDIIPSIFIVAWTYGLFLGFLLGNNVTYVISNFAGMTLYSIYFLMVFSKIDVERLVMIVLFAAVTNAIYSYGSTFWEIIFKGKFYFESLRMYNSTGLSVLGPFLASSLVSVGLLRRSDGNNKMKSTALFLFFVIPYGVLSFSKGYFASVVMLFALISIILLLSAVRSLKVTHGGLFLMAFFITCVALTIYNFADELLFLFSVEESGNYLRNEQKYILVGEFNFFGKGLGAVTESGYFRNEGQPYGFELTYYNIIHKLGSVGALVLLAYAVCIAIPLTYILGGKGRRFSWLAIGGMLFIVPGYGNATLFAPVVVTLHCAVMYLIRNLILKK